MPKQSWQYRKTRAVPKREKVPSLAGRFSLIDEINVLRLPSIFLTGTAAAGAIALINAVGNLGGYVGPFIVGWIKRFHAPPTRQRLVISPQPCK